jgi:hypothetical protein
MLCPTTKWDACEQQGVTREHRIRMSEEEMEQLAEVRRQMFDTEDVPLAAVIPRLTNDWLECNTDE